MSILKKIKFKWQLLELFFRFGNSTKWKRNWNELFIRKIWRNVNQKMVPSIEMFNCLKFTLKVSWSRNIISV
jgi:hypothetical protein